MQKKTNLIIFISLIIIGIALDISPIEVPDGIDKVYHFTGFFLITLSSIITFTSYFGKKWLNLFFIIILIIGGFCAGVSEDAQKLTVMRECSVFDWFANLGGISLAGAIAYILNSKKNTEEEI